LASSARFLEADFEALVAIVDDGHVVFLLDLLREREWKRDEVVDADAAFEGKLQTVLIGIAIEAAVNGAGSAGLAVIEAVGATFLAARAVREVAAPPRASIALSRRARAL